MIRFCSSIKERHHLTSSAMRMSQATPDHNRHTTANRCDHRPELSDTHIGRNLCLRRSAIAVQVRGADNAGGTS